MTDNWPLFLEPHDGFHHVQAREIRIGDLIYWNHSEGRVVAVECTPANIYRHLRAFWIDGDFGRTMTEVYGDHQELIRVER